MRVIQEGRTIDSTELRIQLALIQIKRNIDADMNRLGDCDITRAQLATLYAIEKRGICKMKELADVMEVKPSAMTVMMDRLEKANYIKRTHDTDDRRVVLVDITEAGKAALQKAIEQREQLLKGYLADLNPDERETLARLLEKVVSARTKDGT